MRTPLLFLLHRPLPAATLAWLLAAGGSALLPASAVQADEQRAVREAVSTGRYMPLAEILKIVEQHVPGRVIEVELESDRVHGMVYDVEVLDASNRKREIKVHAQTGQLVELDDRPIAGEQPVLPLPQILRPLLLLHPGYVEEVELETGRDGQPVYQVKLVQGNAQRLDLVIDATTGALLRGAPDAGTTAMQALPDLLEALLQTYPGTVLEAELERERHHGTDAWYYEVDIRLDGGGTVELHVDTRSGEVLREKHKH